MQCGAHTRSGKQCGNHALPGATVCRMHGGKAPQTQQAATRNLALKRAQRMVELAGVDMDPIAHLLDSLYRAYTLVKVWGIMAATIDDRAEEELEDGEIRGRLSYVENTNSDDPDELIVTSHDRLLALSSSGEARVHPYMLQYEAAIDRHAKIARQCIDAKIGERQIQLAERMGEQLSALFERTVSAIEGLNDAQRLQAATAYSREIAMLERPAIDGTSRAA
jgi:hypothetical protein